MKAISLWQPWATLVVVGAKQIETRSWSTSYRGTLLIHAGLKCTRALIELCHEEPFRTALRAAGVQRWQDLPLGAVIGTAQIVDCRRIATPYVPTAAGFSEYHEDPRDDGMAPPPEPERSFGNYDEAGRFAWILRDAVRWHEPKPARGRQQLFDIPPEELDLR